MRDIISVKTELPRSLLFVQDSITPIDLHAFADASIAANCPAVYVVVYQLNSVSQGPVSSK